MHLRYMIEIDGNLTGTTIPSQSQLENNGNEEVLYISQPLRLKLHNQMQFNVIPKIVNGFKYFYLIILFNIIHSFQYS